ncbi:L,D-transpeptidase family protein [Qipengyuania sp. DSG2-2]|uniref:L,D-transpeptidase family protein n=1 Tax=Qipengyuania sp. DGS2-2 TaxID=3349631 RepID=UPI0036D36204
MVDGFFTIRRLTAVLCVAPLMVLGACKAAPDASVSNALALAPVAEATTAKLASAVIATAPAKDEKATGPAAKMPPVIGDILETGTLIVISKGSQNMHVFRDGALWDSSPVSTGKRGKETPSGVFPILQKKVFHRSNLYSNAPMPHMQRLTWDGIAIHAGRLPGYAASHGCIRLPSSFAKALFQQTSHETTAVVVVDQAVHSQEHARQVALRMPLPIARTDGSGGLIQNPEPELAQFAEALPPVGEEKPTAQTLPTRLAQSGEIIQLAAATSAGAAEDHWSKMVAKHPDLRTMNKAVIAATVNGQKVYRLRVGGDQAHAACDAIKVGGGACFPVS